MERNKIPGVPLRVVCDAGPIIHLDELEVLFLLSDFDQVLLPNAVWAEVERQRHDLSPIVWDSESMEQSD